MKAILQAFGKLVCGVKRKHVWQRPVKAGSFYGKTCKRCMEYREVKRRKTKGESNVL